MVFVGTHKTKHKIVLETENIPPAPKLNKSLTKDRLQQFLRIFFDSAFYVLPSAKMSSSLDKNGPSQTELYGRAVMDWQNVARHLPNSVPVSSRHRPSVPSTLYRQSGVSTTDVHPKGITFLRRVRVHATLPLQRSDPGGSSRPDNKRALPNCAFNLKKSRSL